jgi:hypothetical protein
VSRAREAGWDEKKICYRKKCPKRCEEHKVDTGRRPVAVGAAVCIDYCRVLVDIIEKGVQRHTVCRQAHDDDGEDHLYATKA